MARRGLIDELRLIANPMHLGKVIVIKHPKEDNILQKLKEVLELSYSDVFLSDLNILEIKELIDIYMNNIIIQRVVNDVLNKTIDKVIEDSDKFDFCLPFD